MKTFGCLFGLTCLVIALIWNVIVTAENNVKEITKSEAIHHNWLDMGNTVSLNIERPIGDLKYSKATIITTKGQFWSFTDAPNPFIVGQKVLVRDDGVWAYINGRSYYLSKPQDY